MPLILLDSGPLGLLANPREEGLPVACRRWLAGMLAARIDVAVSGVIYYEVRRELVRAGRSRGVRRLDGLVDELLCFEVDRNTLILASELWAQCRNIGLTTSAEPALDADVILGATAQLASLDGTHVVVASDNVAHLELFAETRQWENIESSDL